MNKKQTRLEQDTLGYVHGIAAMLCILAPFIVFLTNNSYSLFAPEVLPLYLFCVLIGLGVAILMILRQKKLARALLWVCLVLSIALLGDLGSIPQITLAAIFAAVAVWLLRENAAIVLLVLAVTHIASTVVLSFINPSTLDAQVSVSTDLTKSERSDLPPVIHIVLDEFAGLHGYPEEIPGARSVASDLISFYSDNGFDLYSHAYAQYLRTTDSIPNMFNFDFSSTVGNYISGSSRAFTLTTNKYFEHLSSLGYKLHIQQSSYLNFCSSPGINVVACSEYAINSIGSLSDVDIPKMQKTRFIFNSFLDSSEFIKKTRTAYIRASKKLGIDLPAWSTGNSRTGPLAVINTVDKLRDSLVTLKPGDVHFAHLMIPHYPYNLSENCSVKPEIRDWLNRTPFNTGLATTQNSSTERTERYQQYFKQITCMQSQVDMLLKAIRESGQWDQSVIIIHGDHGSRITGRDMTTQNRDLLVEDDFRDTYSTFFAVKNNSTAGNILTAPMPLAAILAEVWQIPAPQIGIDKVFLRAPTGKKYISEPLKGFAKLPAAHK